MSYTFHGVEHKFELSKYQKDIIESVIDGNSNIIVNAVAGSGKTSLLVAISKYINGAIFVAFNQHVVKELSQKLANTSVSTIHSLGFRSIRTKFKNIEVDGNKYRKYIRQILESDFVDDDPIRKISSEICRIGDLMRLTLSPINANSLEDICATYDIDIDFGLVSPHTIVEVIKRALNWGMKIEDCMVVDYTDMIYLPTALNLRPFTYKWVLVDEAQDLNAAQRKLVMRSVAKGGRMIFVGDRRQAIYGFAGASISSMDEIREEAKAMEMPLSICYRCPKSHVEMAKSIIPEIESAPDAKEGVISDVKAEDAIKRISKGDLVVCRLTAPLVSLCYDLIGNGIGAKIRGYDIGEKLANIVEKVGKMRGFKFKKFNEFLSKHTDKNVEKILAKNGNDMDDVSIKQQEDIEEAILRILEISEARSIKELSDHIRKLFSDSDAVVWLSTVHRAKGLEADTVWILLEERMPLKSRNSSQWQLSQEYNLRYVALTRAKSNLYMIR